MKYPSILLAMAVLAPLAQGKSKPEQTPYALPEYNQRFLDKQLAPVLDPGQVFYVSVNGDDDSPGTKKAPFKTLEAARDAIRKLKATSGLPAGGVQVALLDGNHHRATPFKLEKQDSGTLESPIVYRGSSAETTKISGGYRLDGSKISTVEDAATLARLKPSARGKTVTLDVPKEAWRCFPGAGQYGMIAIDGHLLTLAQWPNRGYYHIGKVVEEGPTTRWLKPDEKPAAFSKEKPTGGKYSTKEKLSPLVQTEFERSGDMYAQGYFHNDWYFQHEPVGGIDEQVVQLLHHTRYGIVNKIKSIPRRVRLVNVLAELDEPGEWYFDRLDGKLYLWPIKGFDKATSEIFALGGEAIVEMSSLHDYSGTVEIEVGGSALFEMEHTSFVTIRNLTFENMGNQAVSIAGGEYNLLAACTVRNGLNKGVSISGGTHNGITGSSFHGLEAAFSIDGGNFKKLERCYNFATNNDIFDCRRRGYGMIHLSGVGLYFAHNVLHDMNGAVNYKTVDSLIEYNEFYNIGYEMGDFNVAYCGALWFTLNNVVRYNFVHHLLEPGGHPVCAFRNDDGGAGLILYGNVFYRPGRGAAQGQGPMNSFHNNITMDCSIMWWTNKAPITPEEVKKTWEGLSRYGTELPHGDKGDNYYITEQTIGKKGWLEKPWIDEYPELAKMIELNPFAQTFGNVSNNYAYKVREPFHIHGGGGTIEDLENSEVGRFVDLPREGEFILPEAITLDAFVDVPSLDFSFKKDFKPMPGFLPIPFGEIGFIQDEFRPETPDKAAYRKQVYQKFVNDKGGRYNAAKVNARYPQPSYMR